MRSTLGGVGGTANGLWFEHENEYENENELEFERGDVSSAGRDTSCDP